MQKLQALKRFIEKEMDLVNDLGGKPDEDDYDFNEDYQHAIGKWIAFEKVHKKINEIMIE